MRWIYTLSLWMITVWSIGQTPQDNWRDSLEKVGDIHDRWAEATWERQEFDSSLSYSFRALAAYQKAENWERSAYQLLGITGTYYQIGNLPQFELYNQKTRAFVQAHLGATHAYLGTVASNEALMAEAKGDYKGALDALKSAGKIFDREGVSAYSQAAQLQNMATLLRRSGDYAEAISYLQRAQSQLEQSPETLPIDHALLQTFLAYNYRMKGALQEAIFHSKEAINILDKLPRKKATIESLVGAHLNLVRMYRKDKQYAKANHHLRIAHSIEKSAGDYQLRKEYYLELGYMYRTLGQFPEAGHAFEQALFYAKQHYAPQSQHPKISDCGLEVAIIYDSLSNFESSLQAYQSALQSLSVGFTPTHPVDNPSLDQLLSLRSAIQILSGKARLLMKWGLQHPDSIFLAMASDTYDLLLDAIVQARTSFGSRESKLLLANQSTTIWQESFDLARIRYQQTGDHRFLERAFSIAQQGKAALIWESLQQTQMLGLSQVPDSLTKKETQLNRDIGYYERKLLEAQLTQNTKRQSLADHVFALRKARKILYQELADISPTYYRFTVARQTASLQEVQAYAQKQNAITRAFCFWA
ncbi:MAG: tetratricopeptide repeat protein [Bacteroidota bacterium]